MKEAIICIFGSRGISCYDLLKRIILEKLKDLKLNPIEFLDGTARGNKDKQGCPDEVNEILSQEILSKESKKSEVLWNRYKRGAGYVRNIEMISYLQNKKGEGFEVITFGFWDGESKGTKHMIDNLRKSEILSFLYIVSNNIIAEIGRINNNE